LNTSDRRLESFREQLEDEISALEKSTDYVIEEIVLRKVDLRTMGQARENWETQVEIVARRHHSDNSVVAAPDPIDVSAQVLDAFAELIADRVRAKL
jgi:hypothetical protein